MPLLLDVTVCITSTGCVTDRYTQNHLLAYKLQIRVQTTLSATHLVFQKHLNKQSIYFTVYPTRAPLLINMAMRTVTQQRPAQMRSAARRPMCHRRPVQVMAASRPLLPGKKLTGNSVVSLTASHKWVCSKEHTFAHRSTAEVFDGRWPYLLHLLVGLKPQLLRLTKQVQT